jgi:hypothetical protein
MTVSLEMIRLRRQLVNPFRPQEVAEIQAELVVAIP